MTESNVPANIGRRRPRFEPWRACLGLGRRLGLLGARRSGAMLPGLAPCAAPAAGFTFRARLARAARANDDAPPPER